MNNVPLYLAKRYLIAKKKIKAVGIIMWVSIIALTFATAAMILFLSVFSGLEDMNIKLISNINPELKITPKKGKLISDIYKIENELSKNKDIEAFSKIIEEKVYLSYQDKNEVVFLKSVDENFNKVFPLDKQIIFENSLSYIYTNEIVISDEISYRLGIPISDTEYSLIYLPKKGEGLIKSEDDAFSKKEVYTTGVFYINENFSNYIFSPIELGIELLDIPKNSAYQIYIKIDSTKNINDIKNDLLNKFGEKYNIQDRQEQDPSLIKMMKIEKLFIILIFILVISISSFTLAGTIIIIILEKRQQSKSLISLGFDIKNLKLTFLYIGYLITFTSMIIGLILGSIITYIQKTFSVVKANPLTPFPVSFEMSNYFIVIVSVCVIGFLVSILASRKISINKTSFIHFF